jgi:hypothetical protein
MTGWFKEESFFYNTETVRFVGYDKKHAGTDRGGSEWARSDLQGNFML